MNKDIIIVYFDDKFFVDDPQKQVKMQIFI